MSMNNPASWVFTRYKSDELQNPDTGGETETISLLLSFEFHNGLHGNFSAYERRQESGEFENIEGWGVCSANGKSGLELKRFYIAHESGLCRVWGRQELSCTSSILRQRT